MSLATSLMVTSLLAAPLVLCAPSQEEGEVVYKRVSEIEGDLYAFFHWGGSDPQALGNSNYKTSSSAWLQWTEPGKVRVVFDRLDQELSSQLAGQEPERFKDSLDVHRKLFDVSLKGNEFVVGTPEGQPEMVGEDFLPFENARELLIQEKLGAALRRDSYSQDERFILDAQKAGCLFRPGSFKRLDPSSCSLEFHEYLTVAARPALKFRAKMTLAGTSTRTGISGFEGHESGTYSVAERIEFTGFVTFDRASFQPIRVELSGKRAATVRATSENGSVVDVPIESATSMYLPLEKGQYVELKGQFSVIVTWEPLT